MKVAWGAVRVAVSVGLLLFVARTLDLGEVVARLSDLAPGWVFLALALSILQVGGQAWRWRYTAARLGIDLSMRTALSEYYLGLLLNQVLPGGVAGDASRAWRHARAEVPTGSAVRAVVLERLSAQVVMSGVALISVLALPVVGLRLRALVLGLCTLALGALIAITLRARPRDSLAGRVRTDTFQAVLSPGAWPTQLLSAALVVASFIVVYLIAARAVGVETPADQLLPLVAPVLMTMLIPVTVAGWGIREGAAALLWTRVGLSPEDGVAISVAYGVIVLISTLPGLFVLIATLIANRDRTTHHRPDGTGDRPAVAPDLGSPPDPG